MRRYVLSEDSILLLIQMVVITHPLFDAVPFFKKTINIEEPTHSIINICFYKSIFNLLAKGNGIESIVTNELLI